MFIKWTANVAFRKLRHFLTSKITMICRSVTSHRILRLLELHRFQQQLMALRNRHLRNVVGRGPQKLFIDTRIKLFITDWQQAHYIDFNFFRLLLCVAMNYFNDKTIRTNQLYVQSSYISRKQNRKMFSCSRVLCSTLVYKELNVMDAAPYIHVHIVVIACSYILPHYS